jgi:uncharacterized membrane protein
VSREPVRPPRVASRRMTSATLTAGVAVSALCFLAAVVLEAMGSAGAAGPMTAITSLLDGLLALEPAAWASLGTYVLVATPAIGLVVTAAEYADIGDRGTMVLALAVLGVLAISALVAVLR